MTHLRPSQVDPSQSRSYLGQLDIGPSPAKLVHKFKFLLLPASCSRFPSPALTWLLLCTLNRRPWQVLRLPSHRGRDFSFPTDHNEQVPIHLLGAEPQFQVWNSTSKQPRAADALPVPFYLGRLETVCPPLVFRSFSSKRVNFGSYSLNNRIISFCVTKSRPWED